MSLQEECYAKIWVPGAHVKSQPSTVSYVCNPSNATVGKRLAVYWQARLTLLVPNRRQQRTLACGLHMQAHAQTPRYYIHHKLRIQREGNC